MTAQPHPQPLWVYKREPAGMGEWCYHIYRNNHYMLYAESESIAMIICNGLNRDEQAHTSASQQRIDALSELQMWRIRRMTGTLKKDVWIAWNEETDRINALLQAGES